MQVSPNTIPQERIGVRAVYEIRPLEDPRWGKFVEKHKHSSVFHTVSWLRALRQTYGYDVLALTTSPPDADIENGIVVCRVDSWLTGVRFVSLPFSDHCDPLVNHEQDLVMILSKLREKAQKEKADYVELRPLHAAVELDALHRSDRTYCFHQLDLTPDTDVLFQKFHKSSTQRKIQRAEREGLICETGRSKALFDAFGDLLLITRRRHRIPPQPKSWFHNLSNSFGDALQIRVAFKAKQPVASILTLRHKDTLVYKYGCSDTRFNNLGGTHLLFWQAIEEGKRDGMRVFDLGRSDSDDIGLITFKDRWGSVRSSLTYSRLSLSPPSDIVERSGSKYAARIGRAVIPYLPDLILRMAGSALYRHIA